MLGIGKILTKIFTRKTLRSKGRKVAFLHKLYRDFGEKGIVTIVDGDKRGS